MTDFLKKHFFFALAGLGLIAMIGFTLLKETGLIGKKDGGAASAAAQGGAKGADGKSGTSGKSGPGGPGAGSGGAAGRPSPVVVANVVAQSFSDRIEVPGTALSNESITVTTKVQDVVEEVRFESGQYVQKGAVLIVLARSEQSAEVGGAGRDVEAAFNDADSVLDEAAAARADADAAFNEINAVSRDLEAARASVQEAEANRTEARLNLQRVQTLAERGFAAPARLDAARAQLQTAEARVRAAVERAAGAQQRIATQQARATALTSRAMSVEQRAQSSRSRAQSVAERAKSVEARLSDRTIRAPFSGRIGLRNVSPGQLARPGEALATLDDVSQIKVDFDVPESRLSAVQPGSEVSIRSQAVPDLLNRAFVRFVDSRIDPRTRTIRARAYVPNADGRLRPGMLMSVDLRAPARSMPAVPETALLEEGAEAFVFLAQKDGDTMKAKRVPVSVGARRDGMVELVSGVSVGDAVVVEGLVRLRDGQPIRPSGPPAKSQIAAPPAKSEQGKAPDGAGASQKAASMGQGG